MIDTRSSTIMAHLDSLNRRQGAACFTSTNRNKCYDEPKHSDDWRQLAQSLTDNQLVYLTS